MTIQEPSDGARAAQILGEIGMAVLPEFKTRRDKPAWSRE